VVPCIARYAFPIKCTDVISGDSPDDIVEIRAEYDPLKTSKLKVTDD
jgi:glutaminyl-tRNA synthetase